MTQATGTPDQRDPAQAARETVQAYWAAMAANDWTLAAARLSEDFVCEWPQSGELIRGRANFIAVNANYPAQGRWIITVNRIVAADGHAVSDVSVGDGSMRARAITFHAVRGGLIARQTEFWPDDYPAPEWRRPWVERLPGSGA